MGNEPIQYMVLDNWTAIWRAYTKKNCIHISHHMYDDFQVGQRINKYKNETIKYLKKTLKDAWEKKKKTQQSWSKKTFA